MGKEFDNNIPLYLQIIDRIKTQIISGKLAPGQKLQSVRAYSSLYEVNPNTVQRALAELEGMGLVVTQRTSGKFVTEETFIIEKIKNMAIEKEVYDVIKKLLEMGYTREDILQSVNKMLKEVK